MRIAIIGSGIAGLAAAHELHSKGHSVTVYEKGVHIGGHIRTLRVPLEEGEELLLELGVIMHDPKHIHPTLNQWAKRLKVPIQEFPLAFSFENQEDALYWTTQSSFEGILRELSVLTEVTKNSLVNGNIKHNLTFLWELHRYLEMLPRIRSEEKYRYMTLAHFMQSEGFSEMLLEHWFLPQVLCWWGVTKEEANQISIQVITDSFYFVSLETQYCFKNGWEEFLEKIIAPFKRQIRTQYPVDQLERNEQGVAVTALGKTELYDAAVLAVPPNSAAHILHAQTLEENALLNSFDTTVTTVYLHNDPSWMPVQEEWSLINHISDQKGSYCTFWMGGLHQRKPSLFLTWGDRLSAPPHPESVMATESWLRTLPTVNYERACRQMETIQGVGNVWYCGAHVHALGQESIPSLWHENAFRSGIAAAEKIEQTKALGWKKLTI